MKTILEHILHTQNIQMTNKSMMRFSTSVATVKDHLIPSRMAK